MKTYWAWWEEGVQNLKVALLTFSLKIDKILDMVKVRYPLI
jgi:hypothetical protein